MWFKTQQFFFYVDVDNVECNEMLNFYIRLSFTYQMSTKDGSKQALNSIEEHDACLPSFYLLGIGNKLMNSH